MSTNPSEYGSSGAKAGLVLVLLVVFGIGTVTVLWTFYEAFRVYVPTDENQGYLAVFIKKTGKDLENNQEVAPDRFSKGVQRAIMTEGRAYVNPYTWAYEIHKAKNVPKGKLGVRVRLVGDELPYGEFLARNENQKGIVPGALRAGRYYLNPYVETIEEKDPVIIPAGFKGVVTVLAGPLPPNPNVLLVPEGAAEYRGVQEKTLDPETYYFNPYEKRVSLVDCRSQRFNLAEKKDMGFPSKDGFWVSLDGIVEFRVKPEEAARVFVTYNEDVNGDKISEEIIAKIILPNARSFCRLEGSKSLGREFIEGDTRIEFQRNFQKAMRENCEPLGIEIIQALITRITPPERIAKPVRDREIAKQQEKRYQQEIRQQESEQKLAIEQTLVTRKTAVVQAQQNVVRVTTEAKREQEVAVTKANEKLGVAQFRLEAAKDQAEAVLARGNAAAQVIQFQNQAEAAGWKRAVEAFGGNGQEYAQLVLFRKMASAYRNIMVNTADSPIMKIFEAFTPEGTGGSNRPASR